MSKLKNIIYLTQSDYTTLSNGGTVTKNGHTLTGIDEDSIYITTDQASVEDLTGILPVSHGGTGKNTLLSGQVLIGNGTSAITSKAIASTITNDSNTLPSTAAVYNDALLKSGGTMTGVLTVLGNQYADGYNGALNMNNSDIYGLNSIYTADSADNAGEGIHFYRDNTHVDTLWINGGDILFVPNRILGTTTTKANSEKVARLPASITGSRAVYTDTTTGKLAISSVTATELGYLGGVTSSIQTQLNNKAAATSKITIADNEISLGGSLAASTLVSSLGLSKAMRFIGVATKAITDGGAEDPTISGYSTKTAGDVVIDKDSSREYVWSTTNKWELLGGDSSYKVTQTAVNSATAETTKATTFVHSVTQDENGVITVKTRPLDTSGTWDGNATTATTASFVGKGEHTAVITANEFTPAVGTLTVLGRVANTSMPDKTNNANAEIVVKAHPTSGTNYYEARLGFNSNGNLYHMPVNNNNWKTILDSANYTTYAVALDGSNMTATVANDLYVPYMNIGGTLLASGEDIDRLNFGTYYANNKDRAKLLNGTVPSVGAGFKLITIGGYLTDVRYQFAASTGSYMMYRTAGDYSSTNPGWTQWKRIVYIGSNEATTARSTDTPDELVTYASFSAVGNSTTPVYVTASGAITACTSYAEASVNYATSAGSAASCTGNAATATDIETAGTTAQFYRGDNSWSNTIKQTTNAALGIGTNLKIGTAIKDLNFSLGSGSGTGINDGYGGGITFGTDTASYGGIYWQTSGAYGSRLHFATTNSFANGAYTRMIIQSNGNIGIGTLSPDTLLTVNGNAKATKFIGALEGNADTATSAGKWTTACTLTIGNKSQSVDGSGNVSWSLADIGAAASGHNHDSVYLKLNGSNNMTADVNIIAGDADKFVNFWYNANKTAGASWRIGELGSGSSDTNYFVIQSGTSNTSKTDWNNTIRIGANTFNVYLPSTTASTSTITGALTVEGGAGIKGQLTATRLAANGSNTDYNLYINGNALFNIGTSDSVSDKRFLINGNNRALSIGGRGLHAYNIDGTEYSNGQLNLQYYGGNIQIGNSGTNQSVTGNVYGNFTYHNSIIFNNKTGIKHIEFTRQKSNNGPSYICYPESGELAIGYALDYNNSLAVFDGNTAIRPGKSNTFDLGTSSYKWANVYATTLAGSVKLVSGNTTITNTANERVSWYEDTILTGYITIAKRSSNRANMGIHALGDIYIRPGNSSNQLASSGGVVISHDKLYSGTNEALDLGTSSYQWKDTYSKSFIVDKNVTLQYNSTDDSLDFIFA